MIAIACVASLTVFLCCALVCATVRDVASMRCDVDRPRSLAEVLGGASRGDDE